MLVFLLAFLCAVVPGAYCAVSSQYPGVVSSHYQSAIFRQYPGPTTPGYTAHNLANCVEFGHQRYITLKELMGLWNVIEVIEHSDRYNDRRNYLRAVSRTDVCPIVHFATEKDREVRMIWNDVGGYIQYNFRMTNVNNPGFWMSLGYQTGTMVDNDYEHFSGTAQVMKAVQSHMVLTFCSPSERHFSLILSRDKYLSYEEIRGVHKQLDRLNLPLAAVQSYCKNAAALPSSSTAMVVLLLMVVCKHLKS